VSLMQEMGAKALKMGIPLSVQLDVTFRCNERCVHCYLDHNDYGEMTTAEIKDLLDQLAAAGVFFLVFSGAARCSCAVTSSSCWSMRARCCSASRSRRTPS
jgi:MoaA/NifB/PqqE/SkfB family radical SAM enzyme